MKTKNYWFALKSYAYVEFKEKNMLIYDTKHGDRIETAQEKVITLIKEMYEPNNLGVIPISNELQSDPYIRSFIQEIINKEMGDLMDTEHFPNKPIRLIPTLSLQKDIDRHIEYEDKVAFIGKDISKYLTEVNVYLNSICDKSCKHCESYWTNTGAMDEVAEYLKYNTMEIREDVIEMVSGGEIDIIINEEFRAGQEAPKTKKEIYSAMIILGFLSYHDGYLKIPNKELMLEFEKALADESFGVVSEIIENSRKMLKATVSGDCETVVSLLHDIHNSEIPILQYNDENSLSCVLTLAYLSARDTYRVEREEKSGKGYTDFSFHPIRKRDKAFIVELKKDEKVDIALAQIKEKEYVQKFKSENNEVLAVAICYDSKTKKHSCKIERIQ